MPEATAAPAVAPGPVEAPPDAGAWPQDETPAATASSGRSAADRRGCQATRGPPSRTGTLARAARWKLAAGGRRGLARHPPAGGRHAAQPAARPAHEELAQRDAPLAHGEVGL